MTAVRLLLFCAAGFYATAPVTFAQQKLWDSRDNNTKPDVINVRGVRWGFLSNRPGWELGKNPFAAVQLKPAFGANLAGAFHPWLVPYRMEPVGLPARKQVLPIWGRTTTTDTWLGGAGNWSNAALWSTGVPTASSNVAIDGGNPVASTVTMDINGKANNLTIDSDDALNLNNNTALTISGSSISNAGKMSLNSAGNATELVISSPNVTLSGGGTLTLSNNTQNLIFGSAAADTLTNQETIQGAGNIGDGQMTLVNSGTINANQSVALTIAANDGTTNTGTLEATLGGTLGLSGTTITNTNGTINTSGGVISASSTTINGGTVTVAGGSLTNTTISGAAVTVAGAADLLLNNATINNGTLKNSAQIETDGGFGNTLGGTVTNASGALLKIDNNTGVTLQSGTYTNAGTISLNSGGNATELIIGAANITLGGGGTITLSNNSQNLIFGSAAADTLTNQETIQGSGNLGDGQMTLVNSGTINANQSTALTIAANDGTTNTGTLEATLGGTLGFSGTTVTNTNGTINTSGGSFAASSSTISGGTVTLAGGSLTNSTITGATVTVAGTSDFTLNNSTINNGTLNNSAQIETVGGFGNTLGGTATNASGGLVKIDNNTGLTLQGTFTNAGTISLNSGGNATELIIGAANLTLGGGGTITMSNNAENLIFGTAAADTLTNQETIQGSGNIGDGQMTLVNSGTINANQTNALTIAANDGTTNTGTLEATLGGTLGFSGTTVTNTNGTINTSGGSFAASSSTINGGTVTLAGGSLTNSTITGATVTVAGTSDLVLNSGTINNGTLNNSAQIETVGGFGNTLGGTVTNASGGLVKIDNNTGLTLQGTFTNAGTISLNSAGNATELIIGVANLTLGGGGIVTMSNNAENLIFGTAAADKLTNQETIQGSGNIGDGQMTLVNSGTINANQSNALTIAANDGTTNTGTLEATLGGTLGFSGTIVTNTGGTLNTSGGSFAASSSTINGGTVTLAGGSLTNSTITGATVTVAGTSDLVLNSGTINNGTLNNSAQIETVGGFGNTLGGTVTNASGGLVKIDNNTGLTLQGTFTNAGTISLNSAGNATELIISTANLTLGGGGTITMSNNAENLIFGTAAADKLTNQETIQGSGNIGDGQMTLVNSGTINANQSAPLTIAANDGTTNTGTLEATVGGTLDFSGTVVTNTSGTINTSGGSFAASSSTINGGTVTLAGGALTSSTITGAKVTVAGTSNLTLNSSTIDNGTLTNSAQMEVVGGFSNTLGGTVTNAAGALIKIDNNTGLNLLTGTYSNAGTISLNSTGNATELIINAPAVTLGGGGTVTMSNNSENLIFGAAAANVLTNQETIEGSGNIGNGQMGLVNSGTILANQSVPLVIDTSSSGFNNKGTLSVSAGDTLVISANTPFTNFSGSTLTGGTYNVTGTLEFGASGTSLVTNAANITLTGNLSQILNTAGANLLSGFTTNAAAGKFTLAGNQNLTTTGGSFTNAGIFNVFKGSTFTVGGSSFNFMQSGGLATIDGTLTSSSPGTLSVTAGSLFGEGTLGYSVVDSATVMPGDSSTKTGDLAVTKGYTQNSVGALDISIAGTAAKQFDQLNVTSTASLNGTLNISLVNGFVPTVGSTFDILNASSVSGTFATVTGTSINSSEHFTVTYNGNDVVLTVVSGPGTAEQSGSLLRAARRRSGLLPSRTYTYGSAVSHLASLPSTTQNHWVAPIAVSAVGNHTHTFRALDDFPVTPAAPAFGSASGADVSGAVFRTFAPGAESFNNMASMNHKRLEIGVDLKALVKTSPRKLVRALTADPDSNDALSIGYVTMTASH